MLTQLLFIAVVILSASGALWVFSQDWRGGGSTGDGRGGRVLRIGVPLAVWLGLLAALAKAGFFLDTRSMPPRIAIAFVPALLLVPCLALLPRISGFIASLPGTWLLGLQVFRLPVELVLLRLHDERLVPRSMTFQGRNFDILIGLSAPFLAYLYGRSKDKYVRRLVVCWNILGLLLVTNVMVQGILSAPSALRLLHEDFANTAIQLFPYVWLPGFLVPLAMILHVLSLRQLWQRRRAGRSLFVP